MFLTYCTNLAVSRRDHTSLAYANQLGALEARGSEANPRGLNLRTPMYKANDSSDFHLMELISPAHEIQRRLAEGRRGLMTPQQQSQTYSSRSKSLDNTPRIPHLTKPSKNSHLPPASSRPAFSTRFFAADRPRTAPTPKRAEKPLKKSQTLTLHELEDLRIYNSELVSPIACRDQPSDDDQKASDLRLISRLWHQECKCSVTIQQRLAYLLNAKYKEAFDDGRMYTAEKCKHNDFKAEVARILKRLERAGAPQLPTLNVKYELAVACVDEMFGSKGMGEEYMKLEAYFLQQPRISSCSNVRSGDGNQQLVKEIAERVQREYKDVQNITGFMLDQLSLFEILWPDTAS